MYVHTYILCRSCGGVEQVVLVRDLHQTVLVSHELSVTFENLFSTLERLAGSKLGTGKSGQGQRAQRRLILLQQFETVLVR
jgi:hypothetical protein